MAQPGGASRRSSRTALRHRDLKPGGHGLSHRRGHAAERHTYIMYLTKWDLGFFSRPAQLAHFAGVASAYNPANTRDRPSEFLTL